jgi:hypothetical protein
MVRVVRFVLLVLGGMVKLGRPGRPGPSDTGQARDKLAVARRAGMHPVNGHFASPRVRHNKKCRI